MTGLTTGYGLARAGTLSILFHALRPAVGRVGKVFAGRPLICYSRWSALDQEATKNSGYARFRANQPIPVLLEHKERYQKLVAGMFVSLTGISTPYAPVRQSAPAKTLLSLVVYAIRNACPIRLSNVRKKKRTMIHPKTQFRLPI